MPNDFKPNSPQADYEPRWFIWTIVFLVATGISLVGYISLSEGADADNSMVQHQAK